MGLRKYARQRLVPFVVALLGIALLCVLFGDIALAEDTGPPACGGKILEKCTPNSGDTAWMLTSVALVLMMTVPGLGLFYGGMVRKKNVGDTVMTSFAVTCLVTILFALFTYSMAFRAGSPFIGGLDRMFLKDILSDIGKGGIGNPNPLAATIPAVMEGAYGHVQAVKTYFAHFQECLERDLTPSPDALDGARTIATAYACWESIRTGAPVRVRNSF